MTERHKVAYHLRTAAEIHCVSGLLPTVVVYTGKRSGLRTEPSDTSTEHEVTADECVWTESYRTDRIGSRRGNATVPVTISVIQYTSITFSLADRLSIFSRSVLCFLSAPLGCTIQTQYL